MDYLNEKMPSGLTRIQSDKLTQLLEKLIEVSSDTDYQEYLTYINEKILDSQEKTLLIEKEIKDLISSAGTIGISDDRLEKLIEEKEKILKENFKKSSEVIEEATDAIEKASEAIEEASEVIEESDNKDLIKIEKEQVDLLKAIKEDDNESLIKGLSDTFEKNKEPEKKFFDTELGKLLIDFKHQSEKAGEKAVSKISETFIKNAIGPLQIITKPLEDFFNFNLVSSIKSGFGRIGKVISQGRGKEGILEDETANHLKEKIKPLKQELLKSGVIGTSAVYIADSFKSVIKDTEESKSPGVVDSIKTTLFGGSGDSGDSGGSGGTVGSVVGDLVGDAVSGAVAGAVIKKGLGIGIKTGVGSAILSGLSVAGGIGGLTMGAVDAFQGAKKADEWEVPTASAAAGAFFSGKGEQFDLANSLSNTLKFALLGGTIGTAALPGLGTAVGSGVGALLGYFLGLKGGKSTSEDFYRLSLSLAGINLDDARKLSEIITETRESITTEPVSIGQSSSAEIDNLKASSDKSFIDDLYTETIEAKTSGQLYGVPVKPIDPLPMSYAEFTVSKEVEDATNKITSIVAEGIIGIVDGVADGTIDILEETAEDIIKNVDIPINIYESGLDSIHSEIGHPDGPLVEYSKFNSRFTNKIAEENSDKAINSEVGRPDGPLVEYSKFNSRFTNKIVEENSDKAINSLIGDRIINKMRLVDSKINAMTQEQMIKDYEENKKEGFGLFPNAKPSSGDFITDIVENIKDNQAQTTFLGIPVTQKMGSPHSYLDFINSKQTKVEDSIIYKDGKIVRPSPDDNIVTTKENPFLITKKETEQLHTEIENNYFKENTNTESLKKFDSMISILEIIAKKIEGKGPTIINQNNNSSFDFNLLRLGESRNG